MANKNQKKDAHTWLRHPLKQNSAMDTLLESVDQLVDSAAERNGLADRIAEGSERKSTMS